MSDTLKPNDLTLCENIATDDQVEFTLARLKSMSDDWWSEGFYTNSIACDRMHDIVKALHQLKTHYQEAFSDNNFILEGLRK